ncbi:MAG TPA: phosphate signaling complex protein PhoU [Polyangia bacterium]|nr:phosphate signaling complex protein PhoU [Polyangia bacterium]
MTNRPHTNASLESELRAINEQVLAMGHLVDAHVSDSVRAFVQRDVELAGRVIDADRAVNQMELAVDEQCIRVLALYQPEASDLRFVASTLKMVTDLERIGDLAVNMAEGVRLLAGQPPLPAASAIPGLAERAQELLREVLDAFVANDAAEAAEILANAAALGEPVRRLCAEVKTEMESAPEAIDRGVALLLFAQRIERMADHVANIAEMTIYHVRGQDVRHARSV